MVVFYFRDSEELESLIINRGVNSSLLLNTTKNPTVVLQQAVSNTLYLSSQAAVVLNKNGQVVTAYTAKEFQPHIQNVRYQASKNK